MHRWIPMVAMAAVLGGAASAQEDSSAGLARADRLRIAEAFRLAGELGDSVWPGWHDAPFAVLLVTPDREFLIRHPAPTPEFTRTGYDSMLGGDVYTRPAVFPPNLQATFPAVGGVPTIVLGTADATHLSSTRWVLTLLHEHFHQYQTSRPDYYAKVNALDLSGGDTTGSWMLNYPFPYDSAPVVVAFGRLSASLARTWRHPGDGPALTQARRARAALHRVLVPRDERYLEFQLWQEGVARATELWLARLAAARFTPSDAFAALPDFQPFRVVADSLAERAVRRLEAGALASDRRVAFYAVGAATADVLERTEPGWRRAYFRNPFHVPPLPADPR